MEIEIDNIQISFVQESQGLRLIADDNNVLFVNQTFDETTKIIQKNLEIVKHHYQSRANIEIGANDLKLVCLKIVLYYLYTYNLWRTMYEREKNRDLTFLLKDFDQPQTNDIVINFFKNKYPEDYHRKCETLLGMSSEEFILYAKNREDFQRMF